MIILVTGASAGFGTAITRQLVAQGHQVIATARRLDKLQALQQELGEQVYPLAFDIQDREATEQALASLPEAWQKIEVLVNNAGLALGLDPAQDGNLDDWDVMINTNIRGLVTLTRLLLPRFIAQKSGFVINLGSIAGNWPYPGGNIYGATKAFVRQFSLNLRADLAGTGVRVTNLEPGLCGDTEFSQVRFRGDEERAAKVYENIAYLTPDDIAGVVTWLVSLPPHVNVNSLEVMPTAQSFNPLKVVTKD